MSWSFGKNKYPVWPADDDGVPVPPVYLTHIAGGDLEYELKTGLLEAYGIPHVGENPNNGSFGKVILGYPPSGTEIYVPETMLEDARNILNAEIAEES